MKKLNHPKILLAVVAAVGTVLVAAFIFILTYEQTTHWVDTSNWQSFKSKANIQLKHPAEFMANDVLDSAVTAGDKTYKTPYISVGRPDGHKSINYQGPYRYLGLTVRIITGADFDEGVHEAYWASRDYHSLLPEEKIIEAVQIQGVDYQLIRRGDFAFVATCNTEGLCRNTIKREDGTYLHIVLAIVGYTDYPEPKFDSSNPEYVDFINVLRTMRF